MSHSVPLKLPRLIFGSSALGNLYQELSSGEKQRLVEEWFRLSEGAVCVDSAGKYGAGLALEELGKALRALDVPPGSFRLSNKLGWKRVPLEGDEPRFEPGIWKGLRHDAVQAIGYVGILECWEQGNRLLGAPYRADLLSVHDPDEFILAAGDPAEADRRTKLVFDAYRALGELRDRSEARAIGVGAKEWTTIRDIVARVNLDWVMFAGSLTLYSHPDELLALIRSLAENGVAVINSAVFHSGFLAGGDHFDYRPADPGKDAGLFEWRRRFFGLCDGHGVRPVDACIEFALAPRGVTSIALNTARPNRVAQNVASVRSAAPRAFWAEMRRSGLIRFTPEELS